jgi:hypothetical protein
LMGGLGNQLFQIFSAISYAMRSNNAFTFLNVSQLDSKRHTYWNTICSSLKPFLQDTIHFSTTIRENKFRYKDLNVDAMCGQQVCISGYFQSYKYFSSNYNVIKKLLRIDEQRTKVCTKLQIEPNTVSIHFRLGDYKGIQHVHPLMPYEYYKESIHLVSNKCNDVKNAIYFCEDEDVVQVSDTVRKLSLEFPFIQFVRAPSELEDWEQMLLMSCCTHNVIANSSFSWWGAYFNPLQDKIVCYPSVWFGPQLSNPGTIDFHDTSDLCPDSWNRVLVTI